jgi:2,4-diaminopentanoate dehydrogenase
VRVIQWATGNVGTRALRMVIEHPDLELVGLWVSNPDKAGRDAGTIAGTDPCGVIATQSAEALLALDADCVLYMPAFTDADLVCRLLASGKNVVTTRGDFHHAGSMDAALRERVEAACRAGGTTIHSTGSSPGFVTEALPLALLSLSRRLDCLTIDEFADIGSRNSPELLFDRMGFGGPMRAYDPRMAEHIKGDFAASLAALAEGLGVAVDEWCAFGEFAPALAETTVAAGTIAAGSIAAQRITVEGRVAGTARFRFRANWYLTRAIATEGWDLRESGWRIRVEGDTPLDVSITYPVAPEDYAAFTPGLTAHRAVNAVAVVCAAAPGIRSTVQLPHIAARL